MSRRAQVLAGLGVQHMNEPIRRVQTDILILGSGGAGLFAALHAHQAAPELHDHRRGEGPARQVRLHAHGAGRLQRGAGAGRFGRAPLHGHHRRRQVAGRPGPGLDAGEHRASSASTSSRTSSAASSTATPTARVHQKAFAGQTFDRTVHKGDLTGIEIINRLAEQVWARGIQRLEEHRAVDAHPDRRRRRAGRRADDRHAHAAASSSCRRRPCCWPPAAGRPCTSTTRRRATRAATAWRWRCARACALRDMEMVQFHPTGLLAGSGTRMTGTVLEEGLRGAGGYLLNGERRALHARLRPARRARHPRHRLARDLSPRCARAAPRPTAASTSQMAHLGPDKVRQQFKGMVERCADCGFDLAGGLVEVVPTAHYMMGGVVFSADCTHRRCRACSPPARTPAACTAPTAWAATASPTRTVFGGIAGDTMAAWVQRARRVARARRGGAGRGGRAMHAAPFAQPPGAVDAMREALLDCMWDDVGILRDGRGPARVRGHARRRSTRSSTRTGVAGDDRAFNLTWHDWLNLKNLIAVSRVIATSALAREDSRGAHFREDHPGSRQPARFELHRRHPARRAVADEPRAGALHAREAWPDDPERRNGGRGMRRGARTWRAAGSMTLSSADSTRLTARPPLR